MRSTLPHASCWGLPYITVVSHSINARRCTLHRTGVAMHPAIHPSAQFGSCREHMAEMTASRTEEYLAAAPCATI